jgi:saxitoxin biosynthesis operon SxtJ-like protein
VEISPKKSLEAALAISTGFSVIYYFTESKYFLITAITIGLIGLLSKFLAEKIAWFWFKLAEVLGRINGFILLTILFYVLLTPLAWLMRRFKKDTLNLKKNNLPSSSYYIDRNHEYSAKDIENPW